MGVATKRGARRKGGSATFNRKMAGWYCIVMLITVGMHVSWIVSFQRSKRLGMKAIAVATVSHKNITRIYQLSRLSDITPSIAALAESYVESRYQEQPSYRTTVLPLPWGFGSNILNLAKGYATSVQTRRAPVLNPKGRFSFNCQSKSGIHCFFNTSGIFLNGDEDKNAGGVSKKCTKFIEFEASMPKKSRFGPFNESISDQFGFPLYYSIFSPECANVKFLPSLKAMGPELIFPPIGQKEKYGFQMASPTGIALSICIVWKLTDHVRLQVEKTKEALGLTRPYAGLHVRRGDKEEGAKKPHVREYLRHVPFNTQTIFLASDDEVTLQEARAGVQELNLTENIVVLPSFIGRNLKIAAAKDIRQKPLEENYRKTVDLITEIEILSHADVFIGTGSSNMGAVTMSLRVCRGHKTGTAFSMDYPFNRQLGGTAEQI